MTVYNVFLMLMVMAGAGILGGMTNHLLLQKDDPLNTKCARSLVLGLVGSFLMPLLLRTISSDLIDKVTSVRFGTGIPFDFFVFASLCLVAAVMSRTVVEPAARRLLAEVERAKQESRDAKVLAAHAEEKISQAEPVLRKEMEAWTEPLSASTALALPPSPPEMPVDETDEELLQALTHERYSYRTVPAIASEVHGDETEIGKRLEKMREQALAGKHATLTRTLWFLTNKGHDWVTAKGLKAGPSNGR